MEEEQIEECLEKEQNQSNQLFSPVEGNPMQFAIIMKYLSNFEIRRTLKHIEKGGGEFMGFDPEDNEYINLASTKLKPPPGQTVFDIKYVKQCVKENQVLFLRSFQIPCKQPSNSDCAILYNMLTEQSCKHFQSAEDVLEILKTHQ